MTRRLVALGLLVVVVAVLAGCTGPLGGGPVDRAALAGNQTYDWNTTANTTLTVQRNDLLAVYTVENQSTIPVYTFGRFNDVRPVTPSSVAFRYPNGTVVGPEALNVTRSNSKTLIRLPQPRGQLAMTLPKNGKLVRVPVVVPGSHEVVLPPNTDVQYPLVGRVVPAPNRRFVGPDGRVHLVWHDVSGDRLVVEYYLDRDLVVFGALATAAGLVVVGGLVFFWLQLRRLRERRSEVAWDEDESSSGR